MEKKKKIANVKNTTPLGMAKIQNTLQHFREKLCIVKAWFWPTGQPVKKH